jgi:hypothetical protein
VLRIEKEQGDSYQPACLLVLLNFDGLEQIDNVLVLAPVLGILELLESLLRHEATRAQEPTACC